MLDTFSSTLTAIAITYGLPLLLFFWYTCRVRGPPRAMALAVVAVVPPATMAGIYYWIVIHEGLPLLAAPVVVSLPFALRAPRDPGHPTGRPVPPVGEVTAFWQEH